MKKLFSSNPVHGHQIATIFCTWHGSTTVVSCAKICNECFIKKWVRAKQIWNRMEKLPAKRAPIATFIAASIMHHSADPITSRSGTILCIYSTLSLWNSKEICMHMCMCNPTYHKFSKIHTSFILLTYSCVNTYSLWIHTSTSILYAYCKHMILCGYI